MTPSHRSQFTLIVLTTDKAALAHDQGLHVVIIASVIIRMRLYHFLFHYIRTGRLDYLLLQIQSINFSQAKR